MKNFYKLIEKNDILAEEQSLAYNTFLKWLSNYKLSYEEILIIQAEQNGYFSNESIWCLLRLAEDWISKTIKYENYKSLIWAKDIDSFMKTRFMNYFRLKEL